MTRKDYIAFANIVSNANPQTPEEHVIVSYFTVQMAKAFKADNPRFDNERFMKACLS